MKLKLIQIVLIGGIALVACVGFTTTNVGWVTSAADQWFDSYGNLSWDEEKAHLDNLAITLQHDSNLIGYLIVYAGRRACSGEAKDRALRAKKYMVETRGIEENRIKWIDGGYREELIVFLQPIPRGAPELTAASTVKPSDVKIIKNCKPRSLKLKKGSS